MEANLIAVLPGRESEQRIQVEANGRGSDKVVAVKRAVAELFRLPVFKEAKVQHFTVHVAVNGDFRGLVALPQKEQLPSIPESEIAKRISRAFVKKTRARFQRGSLLLQGRHEKVWVGRWREDFIVGGELKRRYKFERLGTLKEYPTERLARRALDIRVATVNKLSYRPLSPIRFSEFVSNWTRLVLPNLSGGSQDSYNSALKKWLLPTFGRLQLQEIQPEMVQEFATALPLSPKTTRNVIIVLQSLWKTAQAWKHVDHNPFEGLRLPQRVPADQPSFTAEQMAAIILASDEPYRTLYWILAETGVRAGEVCGIRVDDIDLNRGLLSIRRSVWQGKIKLPKTRKALRHCLLSDELTGHLKLFLQNSWRQHESGLLFTTRSGTPLWQENIRKRHLFPLLKKLNIPRAGLHAFRHGNTSLLDHLNAPMKLRQDRLGHADPALTLGTYTHLDSADERHLVEHLGRILSPDKA